MAYQRVYLWSKVETEHLHAIGLLKQVILNNIDLPICVEKRANGFRSLIVRCREDGDDVTSFLFNLGMKHFMFVMKTCSDSSFIFVFYYIKEFDCFLCLYFILTQLIMKWA